MLNPWFTDNYSHHEANIQQGDQIIYMSDQLRIRRLTMKLSVWNEIQTPRTQDSFRNGGHSFHTDAALSVPENVSFHFIYEFPFIP